ncbi:hypothetical protein HYV49_00750 [Candidatus Pacearchaeota archaeon]|nr:hypothetical protein [Candidatus Pacearchaeota archaeon]
MKHNRKITAILVAMFFVTQLIGLAVIYAYSPHEVKTIDPVTGETRIEKVKQDLPYGVEPPELEEKTSLGTIIISMIIAISLIILLSKIRAAFFLKLWFFIVVCLSIALSLNAFLIYVGASRITYFSIIALLFAVPLGYIKIYKRNIIVHNLTELLIYPGIAAVFVPILGLWSVIVLLILISLYDIYAVWHSGIMQQMAQYQIQELKFFAGFFIPYVSKKQRAELEKLKQDAKKPGKKSDKKIKVNLAILGGGDVVFPIITAGVILRLWGFAEAITVSIFATLALLSLFVLAKKGKFYPAMPFISAGLFLGIAVVGLFHL